MNEIDEIIKLLNENNLNLTNFRALEFFSSFEDCCILSCPFDFGAQCLDYIENEPLLYETCINCYLNLSDFCNEKHRIAEYKILSRNLLKKFINQKS